MGREEPTKSTNNSRREVTVIRQKSNGRFYNNIGDHTEHKWQQHSSRCITVRSPTGISAMATNHESKTIIANLQNELQNTKKTYMAIVSDLKQQNLNFKNELKNTVNKHDLTINRLIAQRSQRKQQINDLQNTIKELKQENNEYSKLLNKSKNSDDLICDYKQLETDYKEVECELDDVHATLHGYELKMLEAAKMLDHFERKFAFMKPMVDSYPTLMKTIEKQSKQIEKLKKTKYIHKKTKSKLHDAYIPLKKMKKKKRKQRRLQSPRKQSQSKNNNAMTERRELFVIPEKIDNGGMTTPVHLQKKVRKTAAAYRRRNGQTQSTLGYYT